MLDGYLFRAPSMPIFLRLITCILAVTFAANLQAQAPGPDGLPALRISLVAGNLAQASPDPATGELKGVAVDLARELGRRWNRSVVLSTGSPPQILAAVAAGSIDLGFVAPNPDRMGDVHYSQPYMLVQQSAVVRASATLHSVNQLDQQGLAIGANAGDSVAGYLRRNLTQAVVVESADFTLGEAIEWLRSAKVVAFAGNRQRLGVAIKGATDMRLLPDNLYGLPQAVAVPLSKPELLKALNDAIGDLRANGMLANAIQRSGVDGIAVAPQ